METRQSRDAREVNRAGGAGTTSPPSTHATGGRLSKSAAYQMLVSDFVVVCDSSGGAFSVSLPPVGEARGKFYTVKTDAVKAAGGAGLNVTVTDFGIATALYTSDSRHWVGDVILCGKSQKVVFFSDGEEWHIVSKSPGVDIQKIKHVFEDFTGGFVVSGSVSNTGAIISATQGNEVYLTMHSGNIFEIHHATAQTLLGPIFRAPGIDIAGDLVSAEILEMTMGIQTDAPGHFVVGTDPAFYCRARFTITTVAGLTHCAFGFRKVEAYQADIDGYDEMFALDVVAGDIYGSGIDNGASTDNDDTTDDWADAETHNLEIRVTQAGVTAGYIDDVVATSAPSVITFDDAEVVMPFLYMEQSATTTAMTLLEWECGYQKG